MTSNLIFIMNCAFLTLILKCNILPWLWSFGAAIKFNPNVIAIYEQHKFYNFYSAEWCEMQWQIEFWIDLRNKVRVNFFPSEYFVSTGDSIMRSVLFVKSLSFFDDNDFGKDFSACDLSIWANYDYLSAVIFNLIFFYLLIFLHISDAKDSPTFNSESF
jgi:hypothetical protein